MSEHYDFHYQPTGSGAISGQQVLQQTEDAINELGDYVNDNVGGAMDVAQQALETAQNAEQDAQTALDTANSFSSAIQSAQQDASTALSTAQTAQTTASNASNTAIQAQQDASNAVTTANNASGQVSTLSSTVTALGQRVTTAEGNIGQNTSDITALTTRVGTAEGNITTLQNDVSIAQGNASSAMATAGTVKQQAYVLRYSSSSVTDNSTIAYSTLDNTDNIKSGDKIIDVDGKIFSVVSVDTANQTVTVGSALIDLALDANVVHTSGNETVNGEKTFNDLQIIGYGTQYKGARNAYILPEFSAGYSGLAITTLGFPQTVKIGNFVLDANNKPSLDTSKGYIQIATGENNGVNACTLETRNSTNSSLGTSANRWSKIYGTEYYYGSNNVEFSTKFVTTDTNQTITGSKTFSNDLSISNTDTTANTPNLNLRNYKADRGTTDTAVQAISFLDKNAKALTSIESRRISNGSTVTNILCYNTDGSNNTVSGGVAIIKSKTNTNFAPITDNAVTCGRALAKWSDVLTYKVNGLEPSSLSMPSDNLNDIIDISSYLSVLDGSNANTYVVPANGWISITMSSCSGIQAYITGLWGHQIVRPTVGGVRFFMPVLKNKTVNILIFGGTIDNARFIPCKGNI